MGRTETNQKGILHAVKWDVESVTTSSFLDYILHKLEGQMTEMQYKHVRHFVTNKNWAWCTMEIQYQITKLQTYALPVF